MGAGASAPAQQVAPQALKLELQMTATVAVEAVVAIAEDAGRAVMRVYDSDDAGASTAKGDGSPLTLADQEANAVICRGLVRVALHVCVFVCCVYRAAIDIHTRTTPPFYPPTLQNQNQNQNQKPKPNNTKKAELAPHVPIISEENRQAPYSARKGYEYAWVVDPLDGTKEFLKRTGEFTVNIALLAGARPVLGVVHAPVSGDTYFAVEGRGAYVKRGGGGSGGEGGNGSGGGEASQILAAAFDPAAPGLAIVGSASHASDATKVGVCVCVGYGGSKQGPVGTLKNKQKRSQQQHNHTTARDKKTGVCRAVQGA
jgi:hypothetical protein